MIDLDMQEIEPTIQSPVSKVFVINLDRSTERWRKMEAQLNKTALPFERFPAVDGYKVRICNSEECFWGEDLKNKQKYINYNVNHSINCKFDIDDQPVLHYLNSNIYTYESSWTEIPFSTAGEFGVTCSNRGVWDNILKNKYRNSLILEDDIIFVDGFENYLKEKINKLPFNYDILYLYLINEKSSHNASDETSVRRYFGYPSGLQAYVVSRQGAEKLLNLSNHMETPAIDQEIMRKRLQLEIYVSNYYLVEESIESQKSEIRTMGRII